MTQTIADVKQEAAALAREEVVIETNVGSGDYTIYERIGDRRRRIVGCHPADAPCRGRRCTIELRHKRARLAELRRLIRVS